MTYPPPWLDERTYPFDAHRVSLPDGTMHYVDEGSGKTILMVHGTPTWSFMYRHLITGLRDRYRVIAPDNLGFGLSDKPQNYSYRPADQARNLRAFIEELGLENITLMVHDFGGPIGLSYALDQPQNIQRLVLFNTWMWSLNDEMMTALLGRVFGSPLGRWLYERFNFSVNVMMSGSFGDVQPLTDDLHAQYKRPFDDPTARHAAWVYARELLDSSAWFDSLWQRRDALQDIPALLLWGLQDPAFGKKYLHRWQALFNQATTVTFPDTGHFVPEEQRANLLPSITQFLSE